MPTTSSLPDSGPKCFNVRQGHTARRDESESPWHEQTRPTTAPIDTRLAGLLRRAGHRGQPAGSGAGAFRPAAASTTVIAPGTGFSDDFNRAELGLNYFATGAYWRIVNGELLLAGGEEQPAVARAALPDNVQVDFDARSESPDGDVKCEIFGDGYSHASGYILIFGGWNNTITAMRGWTSTGPVPAIFPNPLPNDGRVRVERHDIGWSRGRLPLDHPAPGRDLTWQLDGQPVLEIIDHEAPSREAATIASPSPPGTSTSSTTI